MNSLTVLHVILWASLQVFQASPTVVHTYYLGRPHGLRVTATIYVKKETPLSGSYFVRFDVRDRNGKLKRFEEELGESSYRSFKAVAADFTGRGCKQIFTSRYLQAAGGCILDCDGKRVHKLYNQETGRVWTDIYRGKGGRWKIREAYPILQWEDDDKLGAGYYEGVNVVARTLHWNGKEWAADEPGPSKIVLRRSGGPDLLLRALSTAEIAQFYGSHSTTPVEWIKVHRLSAGTNKLACLAFDTGSGRYICHAVVYVRYGMMWVLTHYRKPDNSNMSFIKFVLVANSKLQIQDGSRNRVLKTLNITDLVAIAAHRTVPYPTLQSQEK